MRYKLIALSSILVGSLITGCQDHRLAAPNSLRVTTMATGLLGPIGVDTDPAGRIWVTEAGTGKNDGQVSLVTPDGVVHPVITGFDSEIIMGGELNGLNHLLFADGWLYILGSHSKLYKVNVTNYKVGDPVLLAKDLVPEDKRQFILDYKFAQDTEDTHLYNMTVGFDGDLFFTDAGANAIIRRTKAGVWSVFSIIPGVANPAGTLPPFSESVPTGIVFDGQRLLVSTLIGYPFLSGQSVVYEVDQAGNASALKKGFTSIVDINLETNLGLLLLQHGVFGMGFTQKTGQLIQVTANGNSVLVDQLNLPTDLKQTDANTYYVTSLGDRSLLKITR
ncbi:ScyD/ScyE family protein [Spirosoma agri]|uniref:ScyD/ScyE family protein n=1 Tax=Spirosoma agri TaxID=1987381 RepID=A0A6M0IBF6_9BACT|nr:ScyD/ScyE family protein [Spirosoma agri]NEU65328.1 ScyD/ScyE family protein [Spirosoma agri]